MDSSRDGPSTNPGDTATPARAGRSTTGLERECLRQAIHDLRGPLNTSSVLVDLMAALLDKDPALAHSKAPMVVRELQTIARMLDHLVGTSDTLATTTTPMDLGVAVANAVQTATVPGVDIDASAVPSIAVDACATRLPRLMSLVLERCAAALPEGGSIALEASPASGAVRFAAIARGPRVTMPNDGRPQLQPSSGWFPALALARGLGGDLRLRRADDSTLRVEIDFMV